ncbi:DNA replication endonuclease-helicase Dna2 [Vanrija albida]|uniref:DNA helicase n=1 Tax=Vanrija albida TaxID=181172 RepID=A0ABR3Q9A3_9TREE
MRGHASTSKTRPTPTRPPAQDARAAKRARKDKENEDAFMADLLSGLDGAEFDAPPSSSLPSPKRMPGRVSTPSQRPAALPDALPEADLIDFLTQPRLPTPQRRPLAPLQRSPVRRAVPGKGKPSTSAFQPLKKVAKVEAEVKRKAAPKVELKVEPKFEPKPVVQVKAEPAPLPLPVAVKPEPAAEPTLNIKPLDAADDTDAFPLPPASQESQYDMDWDLDALAMIDESALLKETIKYPVLHPPLPPLPDGYRPTPWLRCNVEAVYDELLDTIPDEETSLFWSAMEMQTGLRSQGKTLAVTCAEGTRRLIHLKERWADIKVRKGDVVNLVSHALDQPHDKPIVITFSDASSYIIHHPDVLITMTAIANAIPCPRKPVVQGLVRLPEPPSKAMLYGTVLHSLLQGSLSQQKFGRDDTAKIIEAELAKEDVRLQVWGAGLDQKTVAQDIGGRAEEGFETFGRKWVHGEPTSDGEVKTARDEAIGTLAISGLHEIEEDIWSPKWGLKGKVDASVQARLLRNGGVEEEIVAPLEIKTGRWIGGVSHRAQTMLYTLLMEDRYNTPVNAGLLYYSQKDTIILVEAKANEVRALIQTRNELADWMARERVPPPKEEPNALAVPFMPPTIDNPTDCDRCYASDACMLYRKAVDRVPVDDYDPIAGLYQAKTGHLSDAHAAFFQHWERLLTLEEQDTVRLRAQLWTMTSEARQRTGRCFADMVIASASNDVGKSLSKIHRYSYTFVRAPAEDGSTPRASLLSGHITKGDPVSLSIDPHLLCLERGWVTALDKDSVTVAVTYKIDLEALLARSRRQVSADGVRFRIDKDEMSSGMTRMRGNLAQLFVAGGDEKRRRLVVDLEAPAFDESLAPSEEEIPASLNADQRNAMHKVLTAKDYALVLGMPGTGKTTTIAEIIKALVARGKSVLLTSYTHSAVDTIVSKLVNADFQTLRIGNIDKVHRDVQHMTLESLGPSTSAEQMEARLMTPPVVAATCLSIEHPIFARRKFDYCIVDEASQITLPTCLGPLRCADTFVLVGDHFQLPPIVKKAEARGGGLDVSLFRRLSDAHTAAVAPLASQYRMNEDIMLLSNRLIYEGRLRCGSEAVANQALTLRERKACTEHCPAAADDCWLQGLLDENVKAVFVDTDLVPAHDVRVGDLIQNPVEASLVWQLARAIVGSGVREHDMAVITPYRQQIKLLSGLFTDLPNVEILTADKSQGRDKDCILISLVRSNEAGHIGDLLRDWRRINVSFTRARKKLVIFGSRSTLQSDRLLGGFFDLMDEKGWVVRLPPGAHEMHGAVPDVAITPKKEKKGAVLGERLLNSKPFVKDILADIN